MNAALMELLCCPACAGLLSLEPVEYRSEEIWTGSLTCQECGQQYPIRKGMAYLYVNDEVWQPKAREAAGWVTLHQDLGIYEIAENSVDLHIPYYPQEPWLKVAKSFDIALEELALTSQETVLDLGAARGWAAKAFAQRGCQVVALDVIDDDNVGLGRAKALMDHAGVHFDRVIGDGENLPFLPESFDLVFCAATLHHSSNLPLICRNISRILRDNGRLCAINEPCIGMLEDEQETLKDAAQELEAGINENRPNLAAYHQAMSAAGLRIDRQLLPHAYDFDDEKLTTWAKNIGAIRPEFSVHDLVQFGHQSRIYLWQRLKGLSKGILPRSHKFSPPGHRAAVETAILFWVGGEILLVASKYVSGAQLHKLLAHSLRACLNQKLGKGEQA
jgi:SAM-dependent methyltransferase